MIDDMLIGTVILDDCMIGQNHLDFLQMDYQTQLEDVPLVTLFVVYFQYDGSPSHFT